MNAKNEQPQMLKTPEQIEAFLRWGELNLTDVVDRIHIIVGPNGKCMCGSYDYGVLTCPQIIARLCTDVQRAIIMTQLNGERIVQKLPKTCECTCDRGGMSTPAPECPIHGEDL